MTFFDIFLPVFVAFVFRDIISAMIMTHNEQRRSTMLNRFMKELESTMLEVENSRKGKDE